MLFVHYFSNLQFNQKGSSLTDPQKFRLTPGFQRRGSIDLQKKEAQETLHGCYKKYPVNACGMRDGLCGDVGIVWAQFSVIV